MIEAVNATSIDAPYDVSEWDVSGLHEAPSSTVKPARVAESVFNIEGKVIDIKEFTDHQKPGMSLAANGIDQRLLGSGLRMELPMPTLAILIWRSYGLLASLGVCLMVGFRRLLSIRGSGGVRKFRRVIFCLDWMLGSVGIVESAVFA